LQAHQERLNWRASSNAIEAYAALRWPQGKIPLGKG